MRQRWNLDGEWSFQTDPGEAGEREEWHVYGLRKAIQVKVPHIWQREGQELVAYSGAAWYARNFSVDKMIPDKRYFLHFEAVDYHCRVWLNGHEVGEHEGGFTPFEFEVTSYLRSGSNAFTVRVYDPEDNAEIPIGKQGSWYTRVSGIWQSVYLEERPEVFIEQVWVTPDVDRERVSVRARLDGTALNQGHKIQFLVKDHAGAAAAGMAAPSCGGASPVTGMHELVSGKEDVFEIELPGAVLWCLENPHLYDLELKLQRGQETDTKVVSFGMRKVEHKNGSVLLNGKPLPIRGALDQAFYPDTIYTAPSDEYIIKEIRLAKEMGFNLLRKHIKVEVPRYLYWADRMGLLIWAEPPNYVKWTLQGQCRFRKQLTAMIERDYNHPSIIIWSVYNEEWGLEWDLGEDPDKQRHVEQLYDEVKALDATRLVCDNSGWAHVKTDINDYHRYFVAPDQAEAWRKDLDEYVLARPDENFVSGYCSKGEPIIVSEFGVWGLPSVEKLERHYGGKPWWFVNQGEESHQEDYKKPTTAESHFAKFGLNRIFDSYEELAIASQKRMLRANKSMIEEMRKRPGIAGYVVTEFTDIEWETNGWLDFLRNPKEGYDQLKHFNGALAIVADPVRHNLWAGERQQWDLVISNHELESFDGVIKWQIAGTEVGGEAAVTVNGESYIRLKNIVSFEVPQVPQAAFYEFRVAIMAGNQLLAENTEELTITPAIAASQLEAISVFPYRMADAFAMRLRDSGLSIESSGSSATVMVTDCLDEEALQFAHRGGKVVFLAERGDLLPAKGPFTFRHLPEGESWPRASSFNYVNIAKFPGVPLRPEMGWEVDSLIPRCVVPLSDYSKTARRRTIHLFGNPRLVESSEIISGYFQGWIGQAGASMLKKNYGKGCITLVTWQLIDQYGAHPIATQVLHQLLR